MQKNYNENLVAGAAIRDDKGRRISKLFEASHPKMTVGYAKNLIMPDTPTEQEFNFRQSGGGVIEDGVAVIDKVKGNSVVWNQQNNNSDAHTKTYNGITYTFNSNKTKCTITGTSTDRSNIAIKSEFSVVEGRKYFVGGIPSVASASTCRLCINEGGEPQGYIRSNFFIASSIYTVPSGTTKLTLEIVGAEVANYSPSSVVFQPVLIDLTQMFGAGNEPATVEEFLQRKPKVADEYAYNEGTIVNNKVEKVVTTGRNIWDEEWELGSYDDSGRKIASSDSIRSKNMFACLPHTSYYWRIPNKANGSYMGHCLFYDISGAFISTQPVGPSTYLTVTTPSNARFVAFDLREEYGTTYNHDICINLSDPAFNGQYFPYEKHELDLSWVKEIKDSEGVKLFEDGMRSAGTAYDEAIAKKAVKRFGEIDMGELNWAYHYYDGHLYFESIGMAGKIRLAGETANTLHNILSAKYTNDIWVNIYNNRHDKTIGIYHNDKEIVVYDSAYTDEASFKAAMQGVKLYYELAEPIEIEYDEKNLTYPVVAGGTEEAIASEPSTAFHADIGYGIDAVKTILDLKARVEALEAK